MQLFRIATQKYIRDLSGTGSYHQAGRWHSQGTAIVYTSTSAALAMLETLVHFSPQVVPVALQMIVLDVPNDLIRALQKDLPAKWHDYSYHPEVRDYGDKFARAQKHLGITVPSCILPYSHNVLLNPRHEAMASIKIEEVVDISIDERLLRNTKY
ncbi:MAG: hypothetical protein RL660_1771 [Bacteroidota bacterium]|jgi:RES domain-containing protein